MSDAVVTTPVMVARFSGEGVSAIIDICRQLVEAKDLIGDEGVARVLEVWVNPVASESDYEKFSYMTLEAFVKAGKLTKDMIPHREAFIRRPFVTDVVTTKDKS